MKQSAILQEKFFRLVLPIAFQQFMLALVGASDAIMLGRTGHSDMTAVSLASQVTFVCNLFMTAFIIGENMFVAQYYGKRDYDGISRTVSLVLGISCLSAAFFSAGAILFPGIVMRLFTGEAELIAAGSIYLRYVGISYLLSAVSQVYLAAMKNCDAVRLSTIISSMTVLFNIVLNMILIFGLLGLPALGVRGAALATVAATGLQTLWCIGYGQLKMKQVRICLGKAGGNLTRRFWKKTGPVLLNELVWGGGFTMYSVIMGHLGADAAAASGIANISKNLVICLCLGLGSAGSILIGNELGAGHFEEAKRAGRVLTKAALVCGLLSGLLLLIVTPLILQVVTLTPEAERYLKGMLFMCAYYLVGKSVNSMTIGGIFPAGGDSGFGLVCDAVTLWCITVPVGYLCAFVAELPVLAVYFILHLDEIIKLPAVYCHYRKYVWLNDLTKEERMPDEKSSCCI